MKNSGNCKQEFVLISLFCHFSGKIIIHKESDEEKLKNASTKV